MFRLFHTRFTIPLQKTVPKSISNGSQRPVDPSDNLQIALPLKFRALGKQSPQFCHLSPMDSAEFRILVQSSYHSKAPGWPPTVRHQRCIRGKGTLWSSAHRHRCSSMVLLSVSLAFHFFFFNGIPPIKKTAPCRGHLPAESSS